MFQNYDRIALFFLPVFLLLTACKNDQSETSTDQNKAPKSIQIPKFNQDSAYYYVARQVSFGPRVPNTEAHRRCREWLVGKLRGFGIHVIEQDFQAKAYTGEVLNGVNIIGQINPKHTKRLLLAAHWDSRFIADSKLSTERQNEPILGADDGGSGVGVLLEIARQLQANPIDMGVDIIFFDAEDNGEHSEEERTEAEELRSMETWCLGSQYWAQNPHISGYRANYGILLDMVGARNARFPKEGFSMQMAPAQVNKIWDLAQKMGYSTYFVNEKAGGITDDHYFVGKYARIPMLDIINLSEKEGQTFGDHWHTHNDNMEVIDPRTLRAVGQVVLAVVYKESGGAF